MQEKYVEANTAAKYDKDEPYSYTSDKVNIFIGWDKDISNITQDMTVTAQYLSLDRNKSGEYPQTRVTSNFIKEKLNATKNIDERGYYHLDNEKYYKFKNQYFKVEPIQWQLIESSASGYKLCSKYILGYMKFNMETKNYKEHSIRNYLNGINPYNVGGDESFIGQAFTDDTLLVENDNKDKVSLLNYSDFLFLKKSGKERKDETSGLAYWQALSYFKNYDTLRYFVQKDDNITTASYIDDEVGITDAEYAAGIVPTIIVNPNNK